VKRLGATFHLSFNGVLTPLGRPLDWESDMTSIGCLGDDRRWSAMIANLFFYSRQMLDPPNRLC
jgi:hypothetical protein